MSTIIGKVTIPTDDQGFVLLQCPLCGEFFKISPKDYEAEDVIEIWCPSCGLKAENYFTDDIFELAKKKGENYINDVIYNELRKFQCKSHSKSFSVNIKRAKKVEEIPIKYGIEALERIKYQCCKREAKIKAIYKLCGSYCPFCGVRYEEYR